MTKSRAEDDPTHDFGDRLKEARVAAGLGQSGLADAIEMSQNSVNRFERGYSVPAGDVVVWIAEILNVDVNWLLTGDISGRTNFLVPIREPHVESDGSKTDRFDRTENFISLPGTKEYDRVVRMPDLSMVPRIYEQDLVITRFAEVKPGDLVAFFDEYCTFHVRWFRRIDGKDFFVAENNDYPPIRFDSSKIFDRVVSSVRITEF